MKPPTSVGSSPAHNRLPLRRQSPRLKSRSHSVRGRRLPPPSLMGDSVRSSPISPPPSSSATETHAASGAPARPFPTASHDGDSPAPSGSIPLPLHDASAPPPSESGTSESLAPEPAAGPSSPAAPAAPPAPPGPASARAAQASAAPQRRGRGRGAQRGGGQAVGEGAHSHSHSHSHGRWSARRSLRQLFEAPGGSSRVGEEATGSEGEMERRDVAGAGAAGSAGEDAEEQPEEAGEEPGAVLREALCCDRGEEGPAGDGRAASPLAAQESGSGGGTDAPPAWREDPVWLGMDFVGCAGQYTREHYERYRRAKEGGCSILQ